MAAQTKVPVIKYENKTGQSIIGKAQGDALDQFLTMMDDPDDWRTVPNTETGENVKLSAEELDIIQRIQNAEYGDAGYNPYEPYVDFFTGTVMPVPLSSAPEPKRRFIPSKWEALKVQKILRGIRKGFIKLDDAPKEDMEQAYDMWVGESDEAVMARRARHIDAPKVAFPETRESYNPPGEYLMTEEERAEWEAMDPEDRPFNFIPAKYGSLRRVPGYERVVKERFGRCLDLLMCPRSIKNKIRMNPDDLLPTLPDPRDLKPFPTSKSIDFIGHQEGIESISVDPTGQWLLSSAKDCTTRLWDVQTGHCRYTWKWESIPKCIAWNPNKSLSLFVVAVGCSLFIVVPPEMSQTESTYTALEQLLGTSREEESAVKSIIKWKPESANGIVYKIEQEGDITQLQWHRRGDYFVSLAPESPSTSKVITIHQLSRQCSQCPFSRMPGIARSIRFHPSKPMIVLATSKAIRIYDLVRHELIKKLTPGVNSISSFAIHQSGDHIICASHEGKLCWFDLDYSVRPYRTMVNHKSAIRSVDFHPSFPLLASVGDDSTVQVIHSTVYSDLTTNPLIVPVKSIKIPDVGSLSQVVFHPTQPWLFAASANGSISLYV